MATGWQRDGKVLENVDATALVGVVSQRSGGPSNVAGQDNLFVRRPMRNPRTSMPEDLEGKLVATLWRHDGNAMENHGWQRDGSVMATRW